MPSTYDALLLRNADTTEIRYPHNQALLNHETIQRKEENGLQLTLKGHFSMFYQ
ncbi:MAG: hypothetical protein VYA34_10695 [Myxococcota bacterium]|nr:hypothetical protein [Myxococcota bacterium]